MRPSPFRKPVKQPSVKQYHRGGRPIAEIAKGGAGTESRRRKATAREGKAADKRRKKEQSIEWDKIQWDAIDPGFGSDSRVGEGSRASITG